VRALPGLLGRRVSLRYRISDPTIDATLTDAVGEITTADPDSVVVDTRGGPVRVPTDAVVAVREIPPARPKRPSWAAVTRLEAICADGWPAVADRPLGQWRLRAAGGFTGRANSCLAVGDPGLPMADALSEVRSFAATHGLPARVQVPEGSPWHSSILEQGWRPDEHHGAGWRVEVLVARITQLTLSATSEISSVSRITVESRSRWRVAAVEPTSNAFAQAQEHVLTAPGVADVGFALAHSEPGPEPVGSVRLAVVDGHLYVTRLSVAEAHRRHGLATALMAAAARWGLERDARWCVLQVASHNTAALALYRRLGFTTHHHYVYLHPEGSIRDGSDGAVGVPAQPDHPAQRQRSGEQARDDEREGRPAAEQ
jgi:GNAT superfamily N-acetyltransferase